MKAKTIPEALSVVSDFKRLARMNQSELAEAARDENGSFVIRKFIKMITSQDDRTAMDAIKFLHGIVTMQEVEIDPEVIVTAAEGVALTENQMKIYRKLFKDVNGDKMLTGDRELLKAMAVNIDHYNQTKAISEQVGFKMTFKSGAMQIRPEVTIMNKCLDNIQSICKMLSLTSVESAKNGINIVRSDDPLIRLLNPSDL